MITLSGRGGTATIDFFGGQILSYVPTGGTDLMWRTSDDHLAAAKSAGKAPRGDQRGSVIEQAVDQDAGDIR